MRARWLLVVFGIATLSANAQSESRLHRDFRVEGEALKGLHEVHPWQSDGLAGKRW